MGWKEWPSWVKGGVISIYVTFSLIIIGFLVSIIYPEILKILVIFFIWIHYIIPLEANNMGTGFIIMGIILISSPILSLLFFFLIGALIGWIYGKIKNKNK
jgi:hypothetical protein